MPLPSTSGCPVVRFAAFELDPSAGELRKNGRKLRIEGQPLQVLQFLLEKPGQVVTREELQRRLWPSDTFVDFEQGINSAVKRLRQALDDSAQTPRFIETLPRRGYRFIYPLAIDPATPVEQPLPSQPGRVDRRSLFIAVCLFAAVGGLVIAPLWQTRSHGEDRRPVIRLAVLPLEDLTGDAGRASVPDEIHDQLIARLNEIAAFAVIARDSAVRYKQQRKPLADIADVLNVDAVLLGEVRRQGQRWHLTAYLASARKGNRLWSEGFEREGRELPLLPSQVARAVAARLDVALTPQEEARLGRAKPVDPVVFAACANGRRHLEKWTADGVEKAIRFFQEAIDADATYAPAWAGLGQAYLSPGGDARPDDEAAVADEARRREAEAALGRALQLDSTLREPRQALGRMRFQAWDWNGGAREFELGREVDPNHPGFPTYLLAVGNFQEAVEAQRLAARLDPLNYSSQLTAGWTAFMAGQFDEAIRALKATINLDPAIQHGHRELAWAYSGKGMHEEAIRECDVAFDLMRTQGPGGVVPGGCEWVYARAGRRAEALAMARQIEQSSRGGAHRFIRLAHVYDALGDRDRALGYLRQAYDARAAGLPRQWYVPMLSDAMKTDPRFQDLIRRTGNPWAKFPPALDARIFDAPSGGH